jgi:MFS family permease
MPSALRALTRDAWLLMATRSLRLFGYGALSVVLVLYLVELGLSEAQIGVLLTATLVGDTAISLWLTTRADRFGRRRMLAVGAALMTTAAVVFAATDRWWLLLLAGTIGVISPSGHEVGPFLSIEQAALSHVVTDRTRTAVFAWYSLVGSMATALGALVGGGIAQASQRWLTLADAYRMVVLLYAAVGLLLAVLFASLSRGAEASPSPIGTSVRFITLARITGLDRSRGVVTKLAALFALDAFGGGFVVQSFTAYWFHLRFGAEPAMLGAIFLWANVLAGCSALVASRLASRFGLINTMVATHLPSNVLLLLIPVMPTLPLAIAVMLARFSISQMDVPARQSYVMAVVRPEERSAAGGITGVARTLGAAISPLFVGVMFARPELINLPFFIAGTLKIAYDLLLYRAFVTQRTPEESARA